MRRYLYLILSVVALVLISASATAQTKVIQGNSKYGEVLYNFDGQNLRAGRSEYSEVIFNWDGQYIRKGNSKYGTILYNFDGEKFRQGDSKYGKVLYNWDGKYQPCRMPTLPDRQSTECRICEFRQSQRNCHTSTQACSVPCVARGASASSRQ